MPAAVVLSDRLALGGRDLLRRSGSAACACPGLAVQCVDTGRRCGGVALSLTARRDRCQGRRRRPVEANDTSGILGRLRWHWRPELVRLLARLRKRPFAEPLPQRGSALRSLLACVRRNHVVLVVVARVKPWRRPQSRQPARETSISARRITHRAFEPGKLAVVDMVVSKKPCRIMMPFLPKRFSSR